MLASLAKADSVDVPLTGALLVALELGATSLHLCEPVAFIHVQEVGGAVLDLVHVDSRSEPEHEVVVGCQCSRDELHEGPTVLRGPGCGEGGLEVLWGRDPHRFERFARACRSRTTPIVLRLPASWLRFLLS